MALDIRHNRAEHAHENFQFRRIAKGLEAFFKEKGWDGLLIGNPESEEFSRFRADAILVYNHGFLIIDLKDYQGDIKLPVNDEDFNINAWYIDSEKDKIRLEIKGGARFSNPFRQLKSYRQVMYDIIKSNVFLKENVNPSRTCAVNLFSGPININRETPRNVPYYKITQESNFYDFLYDYNSPNTYSKEVADALNNIFPAPKWEAHNEVKIQEVTSKRIYEIDNDVENEIKSFLSDGDSGILVLESMDARKRDDWMRFILARSAELNIPQTEAWTHSTRIRRKIKARSGIAPDSLYKTIYGGKSEDKEFINKDLEDESNQENEDLLEVIPIKSDDLLDEKAVVILQDAHLISRSLHQSELLRFGSGRLLEDLIHFLALKITKRKLVCIGDPYSLSYGKAEGAAIVIETLKELFEGKIEHYRELPQKNNSKEIYKLRASLANSLEINTFNQLKYNWQAADIVHSDRSKSLSLLKNWFSKPLSSEPINAVLFYSNEQAKTTNLWIKKNCLNNSEKLAKDDVLLINNNVNIPDDTGFGNPGRLYNGMYVLIKEVLEEYTEAITINNKSNQRVVLNFRKLKVSCLSLDNKPEAVIYLNYNYFNSNGKLTKEEQIALRIFISLKLKKLKEEHPFEKSDEYAKFLQNSSYSILKKKIEDLQKRLDDGEKVKVQLNKTKIEFRKLERKYKRKYNQHLLMNLSAIDPLLNAINAMYGWCITVHKSVGSNFEEVLINSKQGENNGVNNGSYYRWLYSGITTTQSRLFVSNPVEIDPFIDCQFEDTVGEGWSENTTAQNNNFEFQDFEIPARFMDGLDKNLNQNIKAAICLFSESLEEKGVLLSRAIKSGDYISKAYFATPENGELVMVFNNNGAGKVTAIRAERNGDEFLEAIDAGISNIKKSNQHKSVLQFPEDFRNEIYTNLIEKSTKNNFKLELTESHNYQDIFILSRAENKIKFRLGYNGKGMFTYVKVLKKSNINLSIELHNLFFENE